MTSTKCIHFPKRLTYNYSRGKIIQDLKGESYQTQAYMPPALKLEIQRGMDNNQTRGVILGRRDPIVVHNFLLRVLMNNWPEVVRSINIPLCSKGWHFWKGGFVTNKTGLKISVFVNAMIFAFTTFVTNTPLYGKIASKVWKIYFQIYHLIFCML